MKQKVSRGIWWMQGKQFFAGYIGYNHELTCILYHAHSPSRDASKSAAALLFLLLTSKPRTPVSVMNVILEVVEKSRRWSHKTQVSSRCFWAAHSTSPAADSMWYVDWRCCASPRSQNILHTDFEYVTQHSFVERWWRLRPSYRTLKRSLVRGEAHMKQDATCRKSCTVQLASHTKWTITRHNACISS